MPEESKLTEKLKNPNSVKFTAEEMDQIKEVQKSYIEIQTDLGQIAIARLRLSNQLESLDTEEDKLLDSFKSIQDNEKTFVDSIRKKYGDGSLDPKTGTYTTNSAK